MTSRLRLFGFISNTKIKYDCVLIMIRIIALGHFIPAEVTHLADKLYKSLFVTTGCLPID